MPKTPTKRPSIKVKKQVSRVVNPKTYKQPMKTYKKGKTKDA